MAGQSNDHDVSLQQKSAKAQQLAIQYYRAGNFKDALAEGIKAADIDRSSTQIQNLVGAIAIETGDPATAIQYLQHSLSIDEHQAETQYLLGNAFIKLDLAEQAVHAFNYALALDPNHANAALNLGLCLERLEEAGKAERAFRRAIEIQPNHPEANNALAELFIRKTQYDKAEKHAYLAIDGDPNRIELILTLAKALRMQHRYAEAEKVYRATLVKHPHNALLLIEIGSVLREQNQFDDAEKEYEKALEFAPNNKHVLRAAGAFYQSIRSSKTAADLYKRYLKIKPHDAGMLNNLAIVLRDTNDFEGAEKYYLQAIEYDDAPAYAYNNLAILAMEMSKPIESIEYYRKALEADPTYANARSNMLFYLNYLERVTPEELFDEHREWNRWHVEPLPLHSCVHANDPVADRRLRIGYVSADLFGHAVSYFIEGALEHHNKDEFEIFCYANVTTPDLITKRLKSYVDHWQYITKMTPKEIADQVREDEIDILVDLGGHTAGHRLEAFALKPAPIQVTWIGYPNTTGLDVMDYRIVDNITDPVGDADSHHSETLWRLPECFTCYTPQSVLEVEGTPAAITTGQVTFGSFNNATKISGCSVRVWAEILKKVDGSRLILKSASLGDKKTQERIWAQFKESGVPADRVEMIGKLSSEKHMRMYDEIDIALDPFPYNGTTTSCEALFMGSPIIALLGDRHATRVTASLLTQVGLGDLAAANEEEYVGKAVALANDLDRLQEIRKNLRTNMLKSPLCDAVRHTKSVEDAYREMWKIWCSDEPERRKQRRKDGFPETTPYRPTLRLIHGLGNLSLSQFNQCLGSMENTVMLTDVHPLGMKVIPPLVQIEDNYSLFEPDEWELLTTKDLQFDQILHRILDKLEARNDKLVIADWSHLDFIAQPFLASPSYEIFTSDFLRKDFELREIFMARHPIAVWKNYCDLSNIDEHINVDEFLRGYRHFSEFAAEGKLFRCEDFAKNPDDVLSEVCEYFDIPFDPNYADNWPFNTRVTGDPYVRTLEARALETLTAHVPKDYDAEVVARMEDNSDYPIILQLLGYE